MRKLKFRCWDTSQNKMRYDVTGFEHSTDNEMGGIFLNGDYFEIPTNPTMQFTGILDKNGKEIYEGDIIFNDMSENKASVKWDKTLASYTVIDEDSSWLYFHEIFDDLNCYEIIGNIYENPNLL